jgi:hypothetical protein
VKNFQIRMKHILGRSLFKGLQNLHVVFFALPESQITPILRSQTEGQPVARLRTGSAQYCQGCVFEEVSTHSPFDNGRQHPTFTTGFSPPACTCPGAVTNEVPEYIGIPAGRRLPTYAVVKYSRPFSRLRGITARSLEPSRARAKPAYC